MTMTERKVIKAKVGLLELAKQLGSVTQACRVLKNNLFEAQPEEPGFTGDGGRRGDDGPAQRHAGHDRTLLAKRHAIYQRAREEPAALERADPQLDAHLGRHTQPRARQLGPFIDIIDPASRFDRKTCFSVPTWGYSCHGARRR